MDPRIIDKTESLIEESSNVSVSIDTLSYICNNSLRFQKPKHEQAAIEIFKQLKSSSDEADREIYQQLFTALRDCRSYFEKCCYLHSKGLVDQSYVDIMLFQRAWSFKKFGDLIEKANWIATGRKAYLYDVNNQCYKHSNRPWLFYYIEHELKTPKSSNPPQEEKHELNEEKKDCTNCCLAKFLKENTTMALQKENFAAFATTLEGCADPAKTQVKDTLTKAGIEWDFNQKAFLNEIRDEVFQKTLSKCNF